MGDVGGTSSFGIPASDTGVGQSGEEGRDHGREKGQPDRIAEGLRGASHQGVNAGAQHGPEAIQ